MKVKPLQSGTDMLKSTNGIKGRRSRVAQARDCKSLHPGSIPGGASSLKLLLSQQELYKPL